MSDEKADICKVCGRNIRYYKIVKENGKTTHRAFHEGESPEGATLISKYSVSSTYRNRMRQALKHTGIITPEQHNAEQKVIEKEGSEDPEPIIPEVASKTGVGVLTGPHPKEESGSIDSEAAEEEEGIKEVVSSPKLIEKEKISIPKVTKQEVIEYMEIHEFPEGSDDKPELDVSELKRNKFAAVSAIARRLAEVGKPEKEVNEIRSSLIARGGDFPGIVNMASEHLRFIENGQPLFFKP